MSVVDDSFGHPLRPEESASIPLAGGIMQHGYQCGMVWGATLTAGAQAYRLFGPGPQAETMAMIAAQRIVESFRACNDSIDCLDLTGIDKSSSNMQMLMYFLVKGGTIRCFRMAAKYAPVAFREINAALSENPIAAPPAPVSCAAVLAQKMGVSDLHAVMAAGLAGGIGLSGGGCGALGAAVWIIGMNARKERGGKTDFEADFKNPKALEAIDRFVTCTDNEFECSRIVGRRFENVEDHAGYLRDGGCSRVIEALAAA